jgi:hypothetical protein
MGHELSMYIERVAGRKTKRLQTRDADGVRAALPFGESGSNQQKCVVVQIIEARGVTFQHAIQLTSRGRQIGI